MDNVLPISIIIATLILAGTIFVVGNSINSNISGLATAIGNANTAGDNTLPSNNTGNTAPAQPTAQPVIDMQKLADNDPVLGKAEAKVTIIEFSDYQCPFCRRHFVQTFSDLKADYLDTGKAKLIFRDFPLSFHPAAVPYANAAECANEQGKYWEMHDKMFNEQQTLDPSGGTVAFVGNDTVKQWAKDIGLDSAKFNACFDTSKYQSEITKDFNDGQAVGISGTPSFAINGTLVVGACPYSTFQQAIGAALEGKKFSVNQCVVAVA